jgi:hypothetical protein
MQFETYTYTISTHFLPALINADSTGLNDIEDVQLLEFERSLPGTGHWNCDDSENFDFARCDITHMHGAVVVCQYLVPVNT